MRRTTVINAVFLVGALVAPQAAAALAQSTLAGHWEGSIDIPGSPLVVKLDFTDSGGELAGTISIPAQSATDLPLGELSVDGDSVRFAIAGVSGEPTFNGTVEGDQIIGEFTQGGGAFLFELRRGVLIADNARGALADIDAVIESALENFGVPGLAIAVVASDEVVFAKGYGLRHVDDATPVTPDTLFAIGSTTKAFTAFILGTLVDEGELDWDTPLIEYLPDFRLYDDHATRRLKVRDLLIHASGLPRHDLLWYNSSLSRDELFARLAYLEPTRDLGEEFQYQNLMFMTAGYLAERITDRSWEDLVRERIFTPLGMQRSNFSVLASQQYPNHASPYALEGRAAQLIPFRNIDTVGPAGSINSSVSEMSQWMRMQLGGGAIGKKRLIEAATLREMHTPHMAISQYPSRSRTMAMGYGLGWSIEAHRGHFLVQHGGDIDGFSSWVALLPLDDFGVVVYTNAAGANPVPTAVARTVIDRILGLADAGYLAEALEAIEEGEKAQAEARINAEAKRKNGTTPTHPLAEYAGRYDQPGYGVVEVALEEGGLRMKYNNMAVNLEHWHHNTFNGMDDGKDPTFEDTKVLFRLDTAGEIAELAVPFESQMDPIVFTKLADGRLSDVHYLAQFVGVYELSSQRAEVTLHGTELRVALPDQPVYSLEPMRGTEFAIGRLSGFSLEFLLDDSAVVIGARFIQPNGVFEATRIEG